MIRRSVVLYTPILILTAIWSVMLFLYYLNPFNLDTIRPYTWFVILLGLGMIYTGFFTAKLLGEQFQLSEVQIDRTDFPFSIASIKYLVLILTIISLIGVIVKIYLFLQELPKLDMFLVQPDDTRKLFIKVEKGQGSANMIIYKLASHMASLNTMTIIMAGAISNLKKVKLITVLPVLVSALYSFATLQRVYFIKHYILWMACSFIIVYYYPTFSKKEALRSFLKKLFLFVFISAFFMVLIIILRSLFNFGIKTENVMNSFYFYIAGNVFLLDKYLITDPVMHYGASLFRSFADWFTRFDLMDKSVLIPPHYEFYKIYNTLGNTFSYIRIPYEDFGILGVLFISYFWGWLAYIVMSRYLKQFSFFRLAFAAMIIFSFFWSFYGFAWTHLTAVILMFFQLAIVDLLFLKKSRQINARVIQI